MKKNNKLFTTNENGAAAVYVAIVLSLLFMFTALSIDIGHLYGVKNELHNAADAGALAGASLLFNEDGTLNRQAAIDEAVRIAQSNQTGGQPLEDVAEIIAETGHWSFIDQEFYPNPRTTQVSDWQESTFTEIDENREFINAVKVYTGRNDTPSFFAKIFGIDDFFVNNDAVAWIGFAGPSFIGDLDMPIAICEESILDDDGAYSCNQGRMLNSGNNPNTSMTARWTNFTQLPCSTANNRDMQNLTDSCGDNNPGPLEINEGMGTQNGVQDNILGNVTDCWINNTDTNGNDIPDQLWTLNLPVIDCDSPNTCGTLLGAVTLNVVWIQYKNDNWQQMNDVPTEMGPIPGTEPVENWACTETTTLEDRRQCWRDFVTTFRLTNVSGNIPDTDEEFEEMYMQKNIFFLPDCSDHSPFGGSGGRNYGVLARIPKLVE